MAFIIVCGTALLASALTLFSGFGLGTILLPAFLLFFSPPVAVAATAVVHLANNLFKMGLVFRNIDWRTAVLFGVPALLAAVPGAMLLGLLSDLRPLTTYALGDRSFQVTPIALVLGVLLMVFAAVELSPRFEKLAFGKKHVPLGGLISGFFGGLSGHQGALRAAFLVRQGLGRDRFIATSVACAVLVDLARLAVYAAEFRDRLGSLHEGDGLALVAAGCLSAFAGAYIGNKLVQKVTMKTIRWIVGVLLFVLGFALAAGMLPEK